MSLEQAWSGFCRFDRRGGEVASFSPSAILGICVVYCFILLSISPNGALKLLYLAAYPLFLGILFSFPWRLLLYPILTALIFTGSVGLANIWLIHGTVECLGMAIPAGIFSVGILLVKTVLLVSGTVISCYSLGWLGIYQGMRQLGIPELICNQFIFFYRYIFLLLETLLARQRAFTLRSGRRPNLMEFGGLAGHFLADSLRHGQRIHQAMLLRGFDGVSFSLGKETISANKQASVLFVIGWLIFMFSVKFF